MRYYILCLLLLVSFTADSQSDQKLFNSHGSYWDGNINTFRFKHADIEPLLLEYQNQPGFVVDTAGHSVEGRTIYHIQYGHGPVSILLWSQMHGNEPTATMAILDILAFFASKDEFDPFRDRIRQGLSLHFIPLLNPDGAETFIRRNALGIDINRDAIRLVSPESRILKEIRDAISPDFGFNLHDQSKNYSSGMSGQPASISFLAPAFNYAKEINGIRSDAMLMIADMAHLLQKYIPGQVARYDDTFEPRAFGDNIQKWGTSTILVESGGPNTEESKQYLRRVHFMLLLSSFESILSGSFQKRTLADYDRIPENRRLMTDLLLLNAQVEYPTGLHNVDLALDVNEWPSPHGYQNRTAVIRDMGDLSVYAAYDTIDASGMVVRLGKLYPKPFRDLRALYKSDLGSMMKDGYLVFQLKKRPHSSVLTSLPFTLAKAAKKAGIKVGENPAIWIGNQERQYSLISGRLFNLNEALLPPPDNAGGK